MKTTIEPTVRVDIYMAGDIERAKQACREYCFDVGMCVHIEPVDFIYTGGEESGFKIGLINYPRFPATAAEIMRKAEVIAHRVMNQCCQQSCSIVGTTETLWLSRRQEDCQIPRSVYSNA